MLLRGGMGHPSGPHPNEVGCVILEPVEQLTRVPPLFIQEEELIHSKQDTLQFSAFIHILEVHDFLLPESSNNEHSWHLSSSDNSDDGFPSHDAGSGLLHPWPMVYWLAGDSDVAGNMFLFLPHHCGGAQRAAMGRTPESNSGRVHQADVVVLLPQREPDGMASTSGQDDTTAVTWEGLHHASLSANSASTAPQGCHWTPTTTNEESTHPVLVV
jgi:hypothetical protein